MSRTRALFSLNKAIQHDLIRRAPTRKSARTVATRGRQHCVPRAGHREGEIGAAVSRWAGQSAPDCRCRPPSIPGFYPMHHYKMFLFILLDFDMTITQYWVDGRRNASAHGLFMRYSKSTDEVRRTRASTVGSRPVPIFCL